MPFRQHLREYGSEDQWLHTRKMLLVRSTLGVALGAAGGIGLGKILNSLLWEMTVPEPTVLAGIAALMLAAAMSAAWVPARRVLALDPNRVLRDP